tara:strand:- start:821 stop:1342 length:522 start_codon:yes stop_codon:yes gene_type:complete
MNHSTLKRATIEDASIIALLGRVTFTETFGHLFPDKSELLAYYDRTFSVEKIEASLQKKINVYWLATIDRLPVGYAKLKLDSSSNFLNCAITCQLQKIYVLRDFLSQRVGLSLQKELLNYAQNNGYQNIWLSALQSNERALSFYINGGFNKIGTHEFQIGTQNFQFNVMARDL